ncbi:serine/threonine-protein kinase [Allokutzneria oryzae]|uniref:non-specific serine/threonine protein kinase n=1 Tax=Allokutzneria oryzae TaxID=1378989 RepID=A0ABV6A486_9PSEU
MADPLIAGRFQLHEKIGSGGKGVVWRATDEELGRVVAMKRALPGASERELARLRREARIAAALHHPHVVTLFDVVRDGPDRWLVMEYVPSRSLAEILDERGSVSPRWAASIGAQVADAMRAVHAHGIVHGDIKPGNVLVTEDDIAKLTDFGISSVTGGGVTQTDCGLVSGTPAYLAPEVAAYGDATTASDVFSLGATLFAAVEGTSPFGTADDPRAMLRRASLGRVSSASSAGELTPVLEALLQREPEDRPNAGEVLRALRRVAGEPDEPVEVSSTMDSPGPRSRWRRAALVTLAVAVLAAIALVPTIGGSGPPPVAAGDPRSADPCALMDAGVLKGFGAARLVTDRGVFSRCDVFVRLPDGIEVDVELEFEDALPPGMSPPGQVEQRDRLVIARQPYTGTRCEHTLVLADRNRVVIAAKRSKRGSTDLCALAEAATSHAVAVLEQRGGVPRRTAGFVANSLATLPACGLLSAEALNRVPGIDASQPDTAFADWECRWRSTTSASRVAVVFDRHQPLTRADGQPVRIGDRDAFFKPEEGEDHDTCAVRVPHRTYPDSNGRVELLRVLASGEPSMDQLCATAIELARSAVAKLPPA